MGEVSGGGQLSAQVLANEARLDGLKKGGDQSSEGVDALRDEMLGGMENDGGVEGDDGMVESVREKTDDRNGAVVLTAENGASSTTIEQDPKTGYVQLFFFFFFFVHMQTFSEISPDLPGHPITNNKCFCLLGTP